MNINCEAPPTGDKQARQQSKDVPTKPPTDEKQPAIKNTQMIFTNSASRNIENNSGNKAGRNGKGAKPKEITNTVALGRRAGQQRTQ